MLERGETPSTARVTAASSRVPAVDALRGLIMVLMALDHASLLVAQKHSAEYWGGPFPVYRDALAFVTRLLTHPTAPGFFFLMGASMVLFAHSRRGQGCVASRGKRGWGSAATVRHFWIRGALLIAMQLWIVNPTWELSPTGGSTQIYIGVLFALGGCMILASLLLWWKPAYLLVAALALLVGTELLHPDPSLWGRVPIHGIGTLHLLLLRPGGDAHLWSNYPVLPWLELVVFGIAFGRWLLEDARTAFDRALKLGAAFLVAFVIIRYLDGFGNIRPRMGDRWIDFLNVVKYPPSITFTLLTTGVNLVVLGLLGRASDGTQRFLRPLIVFGQVPLFFYLTHIPLYAALGRLLTPNGTSIPAMYPYWVLGLAILYPFCLWYGQLKHRQPANSILHFL